MQAIDPGLLHQLLRHGVRQEAGHLLSHLGPRRAVRLHAHRLDHRVRPAAIGHPADHLGQVLVVLAQVQHLHASLAGAPEALGHQVHADHAVAAMLRDARGHVADGTQPEDDDGAAIRDVRVFHGLPGRGQHVGEIDEAVVGRPVGNLDRQRVAERHA